MNRLIILTLVCVAFAQATKIPGYISKCSKGDIIDLKKCITKSANDAWPTLRTGDKKLRIPPMDPLFVKDIYMDVDGNLKIHVEDAKFYGLENIKFDEIDLNLNEKSLDVVFRGDNIFVLGKYTIGGRILLLPIQGNGPVNITFVDGIYKYHANFDIESKNNNEYINIKDNKLTYEIKRAYFKLDNLFNGDKLLGEEMNKVLDENWREVNNEIGHKLGDALGEIASGILSGFFKQVSNDELFN